MYLILKQDFAMQECAFRIISIVSTNDANTNVDGVSELKIDVS